MKRAYNVLTGCLVLALLIGAALGWHAQNGDEAKEARKIPPESIYCNWQRFAFMDPGDTSFFGSDGATGPWDIFLVRGANVQEAAKATAKIICGGGNAVAVTRGGQRAEEDRIWLAAFFGRGSNSPPAWLIDSVEQRGKTFRILYTVPKRDGADPIDFQHFLWVAVGHLDAGAYDLELYDANKKKVTLMRRVRVE